jgi:hypothetical protein
MQVHTNKGSREKQPGRKPRPNRAEVGLGRPAWADRPSPLRGRFGAPFALGVRLFIASATVGCHIEQIILSTPLTRTPPPQDEGELDELVARINCRMDLPGPTTLVGTRTDYSVGPWDYSTCAARHLMA